MNLLLPLPILLPLLTAIGTLILWQRRLAQRVLAMTGSSFLLIASIALFVGVYRGGPAAVQVGNWPAPFGITLVADLFSAMMVLLAAIKGFTVTMYSLAAIDPQRERYGYQPLSQLLLMGVCGAFLTGDMFNLYVCFEIMLMSSFVLLTLGGERGQIEGAIKYVTLNLMSSAIFLAAVGILYGITGALNMADLSQKLATTDRQDLVTILAMMFLIAFGIKAAVFPLFFWLPASYHTPPVPVSAIFAGLLTKVGVYAIIRVFTLLFTHDPSFTHTLILGIGGLTMITGVLGAAAQMEFRRILSFHIVSQIGYMLMGLGLNTALAIAGSVFYIFHHMIVKTNLFLIAGVAERFGGTGKLKSLGGLYATYTWLGILFLIPAMSLAGMPPLSGFWAKFVLVKAGLDVSSYLIVVTALVVGLLTLFSMTKIWNEVFWKAAPHGAISDPHGSSSVPHQGKLAWMIVPIVILATMTLIIGLYTEPFFALATQAAEQLMNNDAYIRAVLGESP